MYVLPCKARRLSAYFTSKFQMDLQSSIYMSKIRDVGDGLEKEEKGNPPGFFSSTCILASEKSMELPYP